MKKPVIRDVWVGGCMRRANERLNVPNYGFSVLHQITRQHLAVRYAHRQYQNYVFSLTVAVFSAWTPIHHRRPVAWACRRSHSFRFQHAESITVCELQHLVQRTRSVLFDRHEPFVAPCASYFALSIAFSWSHEINFIEVAILR